ncbi:hypothetical protein JW766_00460 [Candidatus Dojkabacteria bacterium]|nr:hypothetical protein [Candidatus Dojkabacteria bacterium]
MNHLKNKTICFIFLCLGILVFSFFLVIKPSPVSAGSVLDHEFYIEIPTGRRVPLQGASVHSVGVDNYGQWGNKDYITRSNYCGYGSAAGGAHCRTKASCDHWGYHAPFLPKSYNSASDVYTPRADVYGWCGNLDASHAHFYNGQTMTQRFPWFPFENGNPRGSSTSYWTAEIVSQQNNKLQLWGKAQPDDHEARKATDDCRRTDERETILQEWGRLDDFPNKASWKQGEIVYDGVGGNALHGTVRWILHETQTVSDLKISGKVYCQDDGDPTPYPVNGATVSIYKDGVKETVDVATNESGNFSYDARSYEGGFAVRFKNLPSGTLRTGLPYDQMVGPTAVNCASGVVTGCQEGSPPGSFCGTNNLSYEYCGLGSGNHSGFDFRYTNCSAGLVCENLASDIDLTSISEDDLRAEDMEIAISAEMNANNVSVSSTGAYTYYTNIPGAYFAGDPANTGSYTDGPNTTITIPAGTSISDEDYFVSVVIQGSIGSTNYASGCYSTGNCVQGGENCILAFQPTAGTCDCRSMSVSPDPTTVNPVAGSNIVYQINIADTNGVPCNVEDSEINWEVYEGSPTLEVIERGPTTVPGNPGPTHYIIYRIPDGVPEGTQYCVRAEVDNFGVREACNACFTTGTDEVPLFVAVKTSEVVCINNNTAARITYRIRVRNISGMEGIIDYVEDTYDSRIQTSWVSSISPTPYDHTGNVIRWDNNDTGYTLQPNDGTTGGADEMEFSYIVTVPSEYFGTWEGGVFVPYQYRNHAIVKPRDQGQIELSTVVQIQCAGVTTGIFDKALTSVLIGLLLVMFGGVLLKADSYVYRFVPQFNSYIKKVIPSRKERFEKKAIKRVDEGEK